MGRILAVDDELVMLSLIKTIIEGYSSHQVTTNNPLEVAELLSKERFDLIITDLKTPGMDGMECWNLPSSREIQIRSIYRQSINRQSFKSP